jgi:hypothetical protein
MQAFAPNGSDSSLNGLSRGKGLSGNKKITGDNRLLISFYAVFCRCCGFVLNSFSCLRLSGTFSSVFNIT